MRGKYAAKWDIQMAGMNFQTRSGTLHIITGSITESRKS
ncbi:DUF6783 domain-containing protein [Robinsoniella peoriensis]